MTSNYFHYTYLDDPEIRPDAASNARQRLIRSPPPLVPSSSSQLWRFMDVTKLISLLNRNALFFTRINKLEDSFEGTVSKATHELLYGDGELSVSQSFDQFSLIRSGVKHGLTFPRPYSEVDDPEEKELFHKIAIQVLLSEASDEKKLRDEINTHGPLLFEVQRSTYSSIENSLTFQHKRSGKTFMVLDKEGLRQGRDVKVYRLASGSAAALRVARRHVDTWQEHILPFTMVNCWHESEYESELMWSKYSGGDHGIAIKTDMKSLAGSFDGRYPEAIARVEYIPYDQEVTPLGLGTPALFKRQSFEGEREVRAIMFDLFDHRGPDDRVFRSHTSCPECVGDTGRFYRVDASQLIREIVISPFAATWVLGEVEMLVRKYGLNMPVLPSSISEEPVG